MFLGGELKYMAMMPNELLEEVNSLSYALFLVAESIENKYLKLRIEKYAVDLLENYFSGRRKPFLGCLAIIRNLVVLANNLNYVTAQNKQSIIEKLQDFEYVVLPRDETRIDIDNILSKHSGYQEEEIGKIVYQGEEEFGSDEKESEEYLPNISSAEVEVENDFKTDDLPEKDESVADNKWFGKNLEFSEKNDSGEKKSKADERRDLVMETVRKEGICFLRDLMGIFPGFSERTLRYDLERLIKDGKIEKIGSSGPGTFYRSLV